MDEMVAKRDEIEHQKVVTKSTVKTMVAENVHIDSSQTVQDRIFWDTNVKVPLPRIQKVMSQDLDMSYTKIKSISLRGNSVNNLILRQRFAIKMLSLTQKKTIFLNIDETWLDTSDYRRMKWRPKYSTNSMPIVQLAPRISMIVAMDTLGSVYLTLTQANTTTSVIEIYLRQLTLKLDKDRPHWRQDTIMVWDNASYHCNDTTMQVLEDLRIPVLFTGPHSYDFAPCELFFSYFKSASFNPERLPLGKK